MTQYRNDDSYRHHKDPFNDPLVKPWKSMYDRAQNIGGTAVAPLHLPNWPNPVNHMVDFQELACEDTWQAWMKFALAETAYFGWAAFVPSPNEIVRKMVLGSYKCGFYITPGFKSPLNLFLDAGGTEMLATFARPITTAVFWWWVAETVYSGLQTFNTIMHKSEKCPLSYGACILESGTCYLGPGDGSKATPAAYIERYDPYNMYPGFGGFIAVPPGTWGAACSVSYDSRLARASNVRVRIISGEGVHAEKHISSMDIAEGRGNVLFERFSVKEYTAVNVEFEADNVPPLAFLACSVHTFTVSAGGSSA